MRVLKNACHNFRDKKKVLDLEKKKRKKTALHDYSAET